MDCRLSRQLRLFVTLCVTMIATYFMISHGKYPSAKTNHFLDFTSRLTQGVVFSFIRQGDTNEESVHLDMELALSGLPLDGEPPDYLASYKNPCWYGKPSSAKSLQCLPYFYLLGVAKAGTTTLYENLVEHPDIYPADSKELYYWENPLQHIKFEDYLKKFALATKEIENKTDSAGFHRRITFEATPGYFSTYRDYKKIPDNWNAETMEPYYTITHTLYAVNPKTKLLVSLRNPTDMLFSIYRHFHSRTFTAKEFHTRVVYALGLLTKCLAERSVRSCIFDMDLTEKTRQGNKIFLQCGMYHSYAVEWLSVFPRNQIKFIIAEDWYQRPVKVMTEIFQFLELREPSQEVYDKIAANMEEFRHSSHHNFSGTTSITKRSYHDLMSSETRTLLNNFFRPFNVKLAQLLGDDRYLFDENT